MRNVKRGSLPRSLRIYSKKWTVDLLKEIKKSIKTGKRVPDRFYNKYKKNDVKEELMRMYGDGDFCYCCYCESIINDVSYEHIEHRMPKNKSNTEFPKKTFDWNNLHLSCEKCNISKGTQYNKQHPILDATSKEPIKNHLGYKVSETGKGGVFRDTLSEEGTTTVEHADLDRDGLRKARLGVYLATIKAIREIVRLGDDSRVHTKIKMLRHKSKEEHGSLIEYILDDWGI